MDERIVGASSIFRCGCTLSTHAGYHPLGGEKSPAETTQLYAANTAKRAAEQAKPGGKAAPALAAMVVAKVVATKQGDSDTWDAPAVCAIHAEPAVSVAGWDYVPEAVKEDAAVDAIAVAKR